MPKGPGPRTNTYCAAWCAYQAGVWHCHGCTAAACECHLPDVVSGLVLLPVPGLAPLSAEDSAVPGLVLPVPGRAELVPGRMNPVSGLPPPVMGRTTGD